MELKQYPVVYLPVGVEDELPPIGINKDYPKASGDFLISDGYETRIGFYENGWADSKTKESFDDDFEAAQWYKPATNVYILTPEELLELKKKWAGEGFDAGVDYKRTSGYRPGSVDITESPDKETYINNLKID